MFPLLLLLSLSIHFSAGFLFPPAGGGCGCAAPCPPPPVCPAIPACPPVQSCPPPPPPAACCPTCSCQKRQKREISNGTYIVSHDHIAEEEKRLKRDVLDDVVKIDAKCNSEHLREIIIQNMDRVTSVAKKRIQSEAETQLDGRYNVICARGDFSYITNTEKFCQETVGDVTCYVFKQLSDVVRARLS